MAVPDFYRRDNIPSPDGDSVKVLLVLLKAVIYPQDKVSGLKVDAALACCSNGIFLSGCNSWHFWLQCLGKHKEGVSLSF